MAEKYHWIEAIVGLLYVFELQTRPLSNRKWHGVMTSEEAREWILKDAVAEKEISEIEQRIYLF